MHVDDLAVRRKVLAELGGTPEAIAQVLHYGANHFDLAHLPDAPVFPMADEPHVEDWYQYFAQYNVEGFASLQSRLPQLCIPIDAGIAHTAAYAEVMRQGKPFHAAAFGGPLTFEHPEQIDLVVYSHPAGALPILLTPHRPDFETLTRALAYRHEPVAVNPSVNAQMIAGFLNWERVHRYQARWLLQHNVTSWGQEMQRVARLEKWRFYDRLMLVCAQPYSGLSARQLGLDMTEKDWLQTSTRLRLEHEFTHYATHRLYGYMSLNLLDETVCDWAGFCAALGHFESRWFLQCLGLEAWPQVRPDGRIHSYCQELNEAAFTLQCHLMSRAATGLEALSRKYYVAHEHLLFLLALTRLTLELLASDDHESFFLRALAEAQRLMGR